MNSQHSRRTSAKAAFGERGATGPTEEFAETRAMLDKFVAAIAGPHCYPRDD
jgi:hypothetical protein